MYSVHLNFQEDSSAWRKIPSELLEFQNTAKKSINENPEWLGQISKGAFSLYAYICIYINIYI